MRQHIDLLGRRARDRVTGLEGVVTSISFDLYGCVQGLLTFQGKDRPGDCMWMDVPRLEITSHHRVMELPNFDAGYVAEGRKGPAAKPLP